MTPPREEWLARTVEEPLEPELPICDPHHHLWDRPDNRYLLDELRADLGYFRPLRHNVVQTVFVECRAEYRSDGPEALKPVGETEFVEAAADEAANAGESLMTGIVGHADLTLGVAVDETLEAHLAASPNRFRGIRHATAWDAESASYGGSPPKLMADPAFREGFSRLQRYNLSFDAWLYHPQLAELADLAQAFPDTTIILDHIGGLRGTGSYADRQEEVFDEWKAGIAAVAACPNVVVKLGGIGMPHYGFGWEEQEKPPTSAELAEAFEPYFLWCIEQFGVERGMFESNFPVDKTSCSYTVLWNAFKRVSANFSPAERSALFYDNAVRIYRLPA